jgi:hypothetical protein
MTAQAGDRIYWNGKEYRLACEPQVIDPAIRNFSYSFEARNTACWRGYMAAWEIRDDEVFLKSIDGTAVVTDLEKIRAYRRMLRARMRKGELTSAQNQRMVAEFRKSVTVRERVTLMSVYGTSEPVPAVWLKGELRIPIGRLLTYVHMGYQSVYSQEVFLRVVEGVVILKRVISNTGEPDQEGTGFFMPGSENPEGSGS